MGAFDDLIPGNEAAGGAFDDLIPGSPEARDVGLTEALPRFGVKALGESAKHAGLALSAPGVLVDRATSLFTDTPSTAAQDFLFSLFVDPAQKSIDENALQPGEKLTPGGVGGAVTGSFLGALPDLLLGGGAVKAAPDAAIRATDSIAQAVTRLLTSGVVASQPMVQTQNVTTQDDLIRAGVDPAAAAEAAGRESAVNTLSMAGPVGATGGLVKRALSGAAMNTVGGAAADVAANSALLPDQQRPVMDPTARGTDAAIGAIVSALLGQRAPNTPQMEGARVASEYTPDAELWAAADAAAAQKKADAEKYRPILEANAVTDLASPEADAKVAALKARDVRKAEAAQAAAAEQQPATPAEQQPQQRTPAETMFVTPDGRTINPNDRNTQAGFMSAEGTRADSDVQAQRAFDVADAQARRKQEAQDRSNIVDAESGEPVDARDLSEARAGGTTTREGTAAITPEKFTFLDAKVRNGQMAEGNRVEVVESGLTVKDAKGKDAPAARVRMEDGTEAIVETKRLSEASRPQNPRFAQDIAATTYAPKKGVGTGDQQPQPRKAGQRITTEESPKIYVGPERRAEPGEGPRERRGQDVTDLAFDRIGEKRPVAALEAPRRQLVDKVEVERRAQQDREFEEAIAPRQEAAPAPQPEPVKPKGRSLIAELRKLGGIKSSEALDIGGERGFRGNSGFPGLFRKNGAGMDDIARWMHDNGWITPQQFDDVDGGVQAARDMIETAMRGEDVIHPNDLDKQAGYEAERQAYSEAAQSSGLKDEDVPDVEAAAKAAEKDPEAFDEAVRQYENDDAGFNEAVRRILDGDESAKDSQRGKAGERAEEKPSGGERPAAELQGETEREIREREKASSDADARSRDEAVAAENKEKADAEVGDYRLTGSDRKADANPNQKDLLDDDFGPGTLRFGFSPKDIAKAFGFLTGDTKEWGKTVSAFWESLKNISEIPKHPGGSPITRMVRAIFDTATGDMRGTLKKYNSATANSVIDMFAAQAGGKRAIGQTFHDAVVSWSNQQINKLSKALDGIEDDKAALAAVADLVRNPSKINPAQGKVHAAAQQIRKALDDALAYMKAAGVNVGEVKDGYFPREFDLGMVTRKATEFIQAAAQAYRETGVSAKDADAMARQLHNSLVFGESGSLFQADKGAPAAPFVKSRVFGKQVDAATHPLNKFMVNDPRIALPQYFQRVARRAETARRFNKVDKNGKIDEWGKWKDIERKIIDEGAGEALEKIKDYVAMGAGLRNPEGSKGLLKLSSAARTWSTLMFLEKATLSSLSEFVTPGIRAGDATQIVASLKTTVQALLKAGDSTRLRELGEDLGLLADHFMDTFNAARFSGGEPASQFQSKVLNQYFRRTGLSQWTEATRVGAIQVGQTFIRRLAKDMSAKRDMNLTKRYLAELGVSDKDADAFAKFVVSKNDGRLSAGDVQGPMGDLYRTAIQRFMNQSIMSPEAVSKPRWMSHPIGSIVGQLQSFNYAFWENVVKRNGRLAVDAIKNDDNYTYYERARMVAPAMLMPVLVGVAYAIGEARDELLGDPKRRAQETGSQKALKAISRGAPIAPIDPLINWITSARYQRGAVDSFAGPLPSRIGQGLDAAAALYNENDPKSNKAERRAARAVYDLVIEPGANLLLSAAPVAPLSAIATQAAGATSVREAFVSAVAGEDTTKHRTGKKPVY